MHIRENTDFPLQKPQQLPSTKANFEGWMRLAIVSMSIQKLIAPFSVYIYLGSLYIGPRYI